MPSTDKIRFSTTGLSAALAKDSRNFAEMLSASTVARFLIFSHVFGSAFHTLFVSFALLIMACATSSAVIWPSWASTAIFPVASVISSPLPSLYALPAMFSCHCFSIVLRMFGAIFMASCIWSGSAMPTDTMDWTSPMTASLSLPLSPAMSMAM